MSVIEGSGTIIFSDSTVMSSAVVPWTNVASRPTQLSQFTNDLGNYGNFLSGTTNIDPTLATIGRSSGGTQWGLTFNPATNLIGIAVYNCQCNCNC